MKSIRQKLFLQIGSLMLLFILLIFIANNVLLEKFYMNNIKKDLLGTYERINELEIEDYSSNALYQISIEGRTNREISIEDEEGGTVYTPLTPVMQRRMDITQRTPPQGRMVPKVPIEKTVTETVNDRVSYTQILDRENNNTFISLEGILDNGYMLIISVPLASIDQNVRMLNTFVLIVGAVVFLLSLAMAGYLSRHFTKPIVNITQVTGKIRQMNFDEKCEVMTEDEIGHLAENINEMSTALNKNITELAQANTNLKEEVDHRMRIDEQRKELLNNVSHELKTPLSMVQGYSEGLKRFLDKDPQKASFYCEVINDEAKKMDMLVSQLLEINHMQSGDLVLKKEQVNAREFIDYILKKYEAVFVLEQVDFKDETYRLKSNAALNIDSLRSEQILTNLLNNAIAYSDDQKIVIVRTQEKDNHLRIEVSNTSQPLPEYELEKLWGSFYKLDKARTRTNGGYGLGLSIIKAIQDADNNRYGVSQDNGYVTFWIEFDLVI